MHLEFRPQIVFARQGSKNRWIGPHSSCSYYYSFAYRRSCTQRSPIAGDARTFKMPTPRLPH
jgi:hypothetical protein